ncbi:translation initiation factor eIF3 subunit [Lodderomyces elongisporus]|uniref:Eukaryotic translation initiation factor 3 subunit I n=1 Tax=Lodderomyces elongisporus (strain ATCC 11503 / CBS 2605 / JCM 1781 / NBRC 1676 / NRRL YB-4239) TaxID=379508 RepID=EIF3I_LODEL|nr:translation initiation factor eIF3 subunit [Lodderomyces elongisporus]A5DVY3.1 RecName: Full=Eukaryotic translation initiation factor 3 subunit I; Short=eIF3i; AltName: Full=Eukaryotic translation initiation factor 3 39 kDa subunit homolog; Short=eIF-3 39 kDa subunit homolog [Lodderomyces elongisporus NRRL YB-4239]EDK43341.1 eukaryotic translation initiation factor 3 39 kDa subunit [Lodderomyces elongisporus NRRL YB-4239]WLF77769.1 translation initiation factor eIF3 subunit [Lodderomyces elon
MRPIKLMGHERSLTQVKYNREGDLLFSVAKDNAASIWYSSNGERLGTLEGHQGVIWSIDVDPETLLCATGGGDLAVKLWTVENGQCVYTWNSPSPVRRVSFSPDGKKLLVIADQVMGHIGTISVYDINRDTASLTNQAETASLVIETEQNGSKATVAGWSEDGRFIIAGHDNGYVSKYDAHTGELLKSLQAHGIHNEEKNVSVTDIQFAPEDRSYFITSSKDKCAVLTDVDTFEILKVYKADAPMNTAAITPLKDFVILGGGQEARNVTTTAESQGKFEARFYHKIFEEEIGRVKGHFGPLNTVAVHPDGTGYSSGGEDGFIRVHTFDKSYKDFLFDAERTEKAAAAGLD